MHAIILAGGLGTRLRAAVADVPKPMASVHGRPFLEYLLRQLRRAGCNRVVLCVGYRAEAIEAHFGSGRALDMELLYSVEQEPLGTGGALKLAEGLLLGDDWLVLNGDSFFGIRLSELVDAHRASTAMATLALRREPKAGRYGSVVLEEDGVISRFVEKDPISANTDTRRSIVINAGIYVVSRPLLSFMAPTGPVSLEHDVFAALAGRGLRGAVFDAPFIDIGLPADYARVQRDWRSLFGDLVGEQGGLD
jgi:D-glycero-alpha-D-manno-heptose 1-phosphate guanylyltransferase